MFVEGKGGLIDLSILPIPSPKYVLYILCSCCMPTTILHSEYYSNEFLKKVINPYPHRAYIILLIQVNIITIDGYMNILIRKRGFPDKD